MFSLHHLPPSPQRPHPLLFVHGAWGSSWVWRPEFIDPLVADGWEVYAIDLPGHGERAADRPINRLKTADYVATLRAAVDQLPAPPIIIAHSMGTFVLRHYLVENSCAGAVLLAPVPSAGAWRASLRVAARFPIAMAHLLVTMDMARIFAKRERAKALLFNDLTDEKQVTEYWSRLGQESFTAYLEMVFRAHIALPDQLPPALVVAAGRDQLFGVEEQQPLARRYRAAFAVNDAASHMLQLGPHAERTLAIMRKWLGRFN